MTALEESLSKLNAVLKEIPKEHRGILFERVFESFHPQENARRLELSFASLWAERNSEIGGNLLPQLLSRDPTNPRIPKTPREWDVAYFIAATLMQWLPTSIGCSFLANAFKNGGG